MRYIYLIEVCQSRINYTKHKNQVTVYSAPVTNLYVTAIVRQLLIPGTGFDGSYNILDEVVLSAPGKRQNSWKTANTVMGAGGVGLGGQEQLMEYAVRSSFKSARTYVEFNKLRPTQQAWRYSRVLGNEGKAVLKGLKVGGNIMAGISTAYTLTDMTLYYKNGGKDWQVLGKGVLDIGMTVVGFMGPVGFAISSTYFILDASTNSFGGFGEH